MAICRWSDDSDVYLWPAGDHYECSLCKLGDPWGRVEEGEVHAHLVEHADAGHKVPGYALKRALEADREDSDYHGCLWENHPDYKEHSDDQ